MDVAIETLGLPGEEHAQGRRYVFFFTGTKGYQVSIPCEPMGRSGEYRGDSLQEAWLDALARAPAKERLVDTVTSCRWRCRSEQARDRLMAWLRTRAV